MFTEQSSTGRSSATTSLAATSTCPRSPRPSRPSTTSKRSRHEVDHPCPTEDGSDRLPVARPPVHRPGRRVPLRAARRGTRRGGTRGRAQLRCTRRRVRPSRRKMHLRGHDRRARPRGGFGPRAAGPHRACGGHLQRSRKRSRRTGPPRDRPGWPRRRSRRPSPARTRDLRLRRPLRVVPPTSRSERMTEHLRYDDLRADTVRQVAKLMAASAITAPKSGGQLFLQGKHLFIETVIVEDTDTRHQLAEWMRARGKERREAIWFRDADVAEAIDAVLLVGLADWYPPNYDCGACGYATCAEFLHVTSALRDDSAELEFAGPQCNLRDIDLGIAVGSAAKTAAIHSIDCRCQTRSAVAARKLGVITAEHAVALSLSMTHKAVGFDRRMPDIEFEALDLPSTGTLPVGVEGPGRWDGARNPQQPRRPFERPS